MISINGHNCVKIAKITGNIHILDLVNINAHAIFGKLL